MLLPVPPLAPTASLAGPMYIAHLASLGLRGCDGGSVPGCSNLGSLYQGGNGVDQDFAKAGEYYDRACQKGLSTACFNLGRLAEQGLGREADPSAAIALYKKACGKGNENACAAAHRLATP